MNFNTRVLDRNVQVHTLLVPKLRVSEHIAMTDRYRGEVNDWLAACFGHKPVIPDYGIVIDNAGVLHVNEKTYNFIDKVVHNCAYTEQLFTVFDNCKQEMEVRTLHSNLVERIRIRSFEFRYLHEVFDFNRLLQG